MEFPPRREWPVLFGLIVSLSIVLVIFQHYMTSSNEYSRPTIRGVIIYGKEKRVVSNDINVFCSSQTAVDTNDINVIKYSVSTNHSGKFIRFTSHYKETGENEVRNVVFLKGHKVAGTTFQNILFRFALTRNLNVMVDNTSDVINETGSHIDKKNIVDVPKEQTYNILYNHVIFNKQVISKFFPLSTVYIGILRDPLYQAASAFYYYSQHYGTNNYKLAFQASPKNPFRAFINRPSVYDLDPPNKSFTNNRQSVDFGFPVTSSFENDKTNHSKISHFLQEVDKTFHLIIIADMFDESLILLRRLLGWKIEDILYTKLSIAKKTDHLSDISLFSRQDREVHRRWSAIDYALYDRFKTKLNNLIATAESSFSEELRAFQEIQTHVKKFCKNLLSASQNMEFKIEPNRWTRGFCVTADFCDAMRMEWEETTKRIRTKQQAKLKSGR